MTIVTPTRNQGTFLESAMGSIEHQTYSPIEHIVIDGGSTDRTIDILRAHEGRDFRWISEPDNGMYEAVNKGLRLARGDVLAYLNSDDAYLPWAVEAMVEAFAQRPEVDVLFADGIRVEHDSGEQELRLFSQFDPTELAYRGSLMQPAVFWRRGLMERIGEFNPRLRFVADLDYWLRASAVGPVGQVEEVIALDRIHGAALSSSRRDEMAIEERSMRRAHAGERERDASQSRVLNAMREKASARRRWARFLQSHLSGGTLDRPWGRFLADPGTHVSLPRVVAGQLPRIGYPVLRTAVRSTLAAEILGTPT